MYQTHLIVVFAALFFKACFSEATDEGTQGKQVKSVTSQDVLQIVHRYLEARKVKLMKSIQVAEMVQCLKWRKVDPSMVLRSPSNGVTVSLGVDISGGLQISAKVTSNGCGSGPGSYSLIHIKGKWQQIMYTQIFKGAASCWGVFGQEFLAGHTLAYKPGLEGYNPTMGDIIFGQKKMSSSNVDLFDGRTVRCDNEKDNFWHGSNGAGERQATIMLRRKKDANDAGIYTSTSCGTPEYIIKDIYVLM